MTLRYWHKDFGDKSNAKPLKYIPLYCVDADVEPLPVYTSDSYIRSALAQDLEFDFDDGFDMFGRREDDGEIEREYTVIYPDGRERIFDAKTVPMTTFDVKERKGGAS